MSTTALGPAPTRSPTRLDVALTGALAVLSALTYLTAPVQPSIGVTRGPDAYGLLLALAMTVPLVARRAAPLTVTVVAVGALCASFFYGSYVGVSQLGALVAIASAAFFCRLRTTMVLAAVIGVAVNVSAVLSSQPGTSPPDLVSNTIILAVLVGVGVLLRRERDAVQARRDAELRERATALREAVAQDRVRIAREMHDIVGHALAGIALQARMGRRQAHRDPDATAATLATIDNLASQALVETRQTVGLMRGGPVDGDPTPRHRLADLPALVAGVRGEGMRIELRQVGDAVELPATVQASAYRIVQESLSNVIKHAGAAQAVVHVEHLPNALVLEVRDNGRGAAGDWSSGDGNGVRGMRERVAQLGGTLTVGPAPGGGWQVRARIPHQAAPPRQR